MKLILRNEFFSNPNKIVGSWETLKNITGLMRLKCGIEGGEINEEDTF